MNRRKLHLVCIGWMVVSVLAEAGFASDNIIKDLEKKLNSIKAMKIDFEETFEWKMTGEENAVKGELVLEGQDRFRVTTEDQVIVSNGKTLWTFNKPSKQVLVDDLATSEETLLPRQIFFQYTKEYKVQSTEKGEILGVPCHILELKSESQDNFIPRVKVWIDQKELLPLQLEQTDLNDNKTTYTLHYRSIGGAVNDSLFQFSIPDGVEVIEMK